MFRKLLAATIVLAGLAGAAIPALAHSSHSKKHQRTLVLTARWGDAHSSAPAPQIATASPVHFSNQGYRCEVTVGTGPADATPQNFFTNDSSEFFFASAPGKNSLTSNCVGKLPATTTHSTTQIVSHAVGCSQLDPSNPSGPTVPGNGISTTYPDGFYSETCNTPNS